MIPKTRIVNVVLSAWTTQSLSIEKIVKSLPKTIYEPDNFSGLIYRRLDPKATIIMFASGRIVSIGTNSTRLAKQSLLATVHELSKILQKDIKLKKLNVENIVAVSNLECKIDLSKLSSKRKNTSYKPDTFPAVIYKIPDQSRSLVFASGKIVSAGAKSERMVKSRISFIVKDLKKIKCLK